MTKEEAKNSLVNTKVYVAGKSVAIQQKLFALGFVWCGSNRASIQNTGAPFLTIKEMGIQWMNNMTDFTQDTSKEVTADYILGLTWEEEKPKFHPFDKVLFRTDANKIWRPCEYYQLCGELGTLYDNYEIIPYESNEHLEYTNNNPQ